MLKLVFILVINSYNGGVNTDLHFDTLAKCEAAKKQIQNMRGGDFGATCLEMQVKPKKLKCKINNRTDFSNTYADNVRVHNLDGYPYPVGMECVEE
jgi:hypothetical protein